MTPPDENQNPYPLPGDDTDNDLEEIQQPAGMVRETPAAYGTPSQTQVEASLRRYLAIQKMMRELEDERQTLRDRLVCHMNAQRKTAWQTKVDDTDVNIRCVPQTVVAYNEPVLRERLGIRYVEILDVDLKKLKEHLSDAAPLLNPLLPFIGTPSREKVRDAIEQGRIEPRLFEGAFTKTETHRFAVVPSRGNNKA